MKIISGVKNFIDEVKVEMSKVSWPSRENLKDSTTVVIVISLLFAAFTFVVDRSLSEVVKLLYSSLGGN